MPLHIEDEIYYSVYEVAEILDWKQENLLSWWKLHHKDGKKAHKSYYFTEHDLQYIREAIAWEKNHFSQVEADLKEAQKIKHIYRVPTQLNFRK